MLKKTGLRAMMWLIASSGPQFIQGAERKYARPAEQRYWDLQREIAKIEELRGNPELLFPELMIAVYRGQVELVKRVLTKHPDLVPAYINRLDERHNTPLMAAATGEREKAGEIVTLLLAAGADPSVKNRYRETALDKAESSLERHLIDQTFDYPNQELVLTKIVLDLKRAVRKG